MIYQFIKQSLEIAAIDKDLNKTGNVTATQKWTSYLAQKALHGYLLIQQNTLFGRGIRKSMGVETDNTTRR